MFRAAGKQGCYLAKILSVDSHLDGQTSDYRNLKDVMGRLSIETSSGIYIAESLKVLRRALCAGHRPVSVLTSNRWVDQLLKLCDEFAPVCNELPIYLADEETVMGITGFHVHRGILASVARPEMPSVKELALQSRRLVVLENIVDHTNVGAVFRSVAGLGADGVVISHSCADPLYRRSVRVSMGAVLQVPWARAASWDDLVFELRSAGFHLVALSPESGAIQLEKFAIKCPEKLALCIGSEGQGLTSKAIRSADSVVAIAMNGGVDSLNAAAASAVAMWALR